MYKRNRVFNISIFNITITLLVVLAGFAFFERQKENARIRNRLTRCKSNLKNISIGLEMYEVDHQDLPDNLQALTPDYLTQIPACPAAGRDTYSESFIKKNGAYTLHCSGNHHPQLGENRPTYSNQ